MCHIVDAYIVYSLQLIHNLLSVHLAAFCVQSHQMALICIRELKEYVIFFSFGAVEAAVSTSSP